MLFPVPPTSTSARLRKVTAVLQWLVHLCFICSLYGQGTPTIKPLGQRPPNSEMDTVQISPDGSHVAMPAQSGSRTVVQVDGVEGEKFDSLVSIGPKSTDTSARGYVVFSADGSHFAFGANRNGAEVTVVDNKVFEFNCDGFTFSPDGTKWACRTILSRGRSNHDEGGPKPGERAVAMNGKIGPPFSNVSNFTWSPDSTRLAYVAALTPSASSKGGRSVVVDDKVGPAHANVSKLTFNSTSNSFAYFAVGPLLPSPGKGEPTSETQIVYLNGQPQPFLAPPDQAGRNDYFLFSPDGKRFAYPSLVPNAEKPGTFSDRQQLVVDGVPGPPFGRIESFRFSPDSRRIAYSALVRHDVAKTKMPATVQVMVDGKKWPYAYAVVQDLQFSPDSRRVAARVNQDKDFIVIDGEESQPWSHTGEFRFGNTARYAYVARAPQEKDKVVVDGKPDIDVHEYVRDSLTFSPDGTRLAYSAHLSFTETILRVDGQSRPARLGPKYPGWPSPLIFSPDGKHLVYRDESKAPVLYLDDASGLAGYRLIHPTFSSDSKHFVVAAGLPGNTQKWRVILNGKSIAEFDELFPALPSTIHFTKDGFLEVLGVKAGDFILLRHPLGTDTLDAFAKQISGVPAPEGSKNNSAVTSTSPSPMKPANIDQTVKEGVKKVADRFKLKKIME